MLGSAMMATRDVAFCIKVLPKFAVTEFRFVQDVVTRDVEYIFHASGVDYERLTATGRPSRRDDSVTVKTFYNLPDVYEWLNSLLDQRLMTEDEYDRAWNVAMKAQDFVFHDPYTFGEHPLLTLNHTR